MKPYSHAVHKQYAFDSFCRKVLRNEARDHYDEMKRQRDRQTSFTELSSQELEQFFVKDEYPSDYYIFRVMGYEVAIENEEIASAIAALPEQKRDIILLSYFLDMTDGEIGKKLNLLCGAVQYKRTRSLRELKKRLEGKFNV